MPASLTVLMPALNEAANIEAAARGILDVADEEQADVELIALTCLDRDGGSDGTPDVVRALAAADPRVRCVHSDAYQLLGEKLRAGIALATKAHVVMIPGDNEIEPRSLRAVLRRIGEADMLLCHPANPEARPWRRRVLSRLYTALVNRLFGERVLYYNGSNVYRASDLRALPPMADSFALGAETVLRLLRAGRSYVEIGVRLQPRRGRSKAFRVDNVVRVVGDLVRLRLEGPDGRMRA
ncbi:MAG TPA: glycosyltransferase [Candidatus Binatia bacterium]|nr:glycosyltransferase [Candidatus Binatia bacterium]